MINREITDNVIFDLSFFLSLSYLNIMENLNFGMVRIPMSMTASPNVKGGSWWESDFGKEFPISSMDTNGAEATIITGYPHPDYRILTHLQNGKMDGESTLFSENKMRIAILTFVEGIANGPCTIYYENGMHFFEGRFVNGYREGPGKEYDEKGNLIYDGLYEKGKRQVELSTTSGYLEKSEEPKVNVQIVKSSENDTQHKGIKAYFDESGEILRLYEWNEGLEMPFNGFYKLYDEKNKKWIEGEYRDGIRNGACKEYEENGKLLFDGYFENGKKLNLVRLPEMNGYWKEFDDNGALKCVCKKDKDGQNEGVCYFYENGKLKKISEWKQGREVATSGYYKFYDDSKGIWYEGKYRNGIREGKSKEYSRNGNILFEGYTINGNKLFPMNDMKPFWKEVDNEDNLVRICEINDDGRYDGVSYFYQNGDIYRISKWKDGKETEVLKMFNGRTMNEFKEGKLWYSGGYVRNGDFDFIREGRGEEYDSDGVTLIYKGSIQNGKRNGHGKEYHKGKVVYDGEWVKGIKKWHYYLYMILILTFMVLSAAASFYIFNGYVGAVVSGIYVVVTCFYCSKKAGIVSSLLFVDLICFLIHLYVGLFVLLAIIVICLSFWFNVLTGLIPLGLVVTAISYYFNINAGIFVSGVFLTYMVFYIVHQCDWEMNVVYWSAGVILLGCIIAWLSMVLNQNKIMKYLLIFAIGLFLIYLVFLIVYYSASKMKVVYSSAGLILSICSMICLLMGVKEFEVLKYILIFVTGLILIFLIFGLSACCDWEMDVVYSSAGVILGGCILTSLIMGSFEVSFLKYAVIGIIEIVLIVICIVLFRDEDTEIAFTGITLIIISCIISGLTIGLIGKSVWQYVLIFGIGSYIELIIYVICIIYEWEMNSVWISGGVIFEICTLVDLILGSFEVSFLKYVVIVVIGIGLIAICFVLYCDEDTEIAFTGITLIIISCIISGLTIGLIGKSVWQYVLIFGIGSYIELIIYVICIIYEWEMNSVWISGGVIIGICTLVDLIIGLFEVSFLKYVVIVVIGIGLIAICIAMYCDEDTEIASIGTILLICCGILSGLTLVFNGKSGLKYVLIYAIGSYVEFIYFVYAWCRGNHDTERVWEAAGVIFCICITITIIILSIDVFITIFTYIFAPNLSVHLHLLNRNNKLMK